MNTSAHEHIISTFFHCSFFEINLKTLRCTSNFQMDNTIEHTLNDTKELFSNIVLKYCLYFLKININKKMLKMH